MNIELVNSYKGTYESGTDSKCIAHTMLEAAEIFSADEQEPVHLHKTESGIKAAVLEEKVPGADVNVEVFATLNGDVSSNKVRAFPEGDWNVKSGDRFYLSAWALGSVPIFGGWYLFTAPGAEPVFISDKMETSVTIPDGYARIAYEARFTTLDPGPTPKDPGER